MKKHNEKSKSKQTKLIVVPTTLLFKRKNEIEKFIPLLTAYFHHGTQRTKNIKQLKKHNLIITTCGTMINDIELLREMMFNYIVLDESQQ